MYKDKKVGKKSTLTERMDKQDERFSKMESKLNLIVDKLVTKDEAEEPSKKEPDRDESGNIIKYYMFSSPHKELVQLTAKRSVRSPPDQYGNYTIEPPEACSFGGENGAPGLFKTADAEQAQRLRDVLKENERKKVPSPFMEVTDNPAFANF